MGRNGCAHAAVATVLDFWGRNPYSTDPVNEIFDAHPPDTALEIGGVKLFDLGCTPGHVENICRAYGFRTERFFSNENDVAYSVGLLETALALGRPVILLVDSGKLGGPWWGHYVVAYGYDEHAYHVSNMLNGAPKQVVFHQPLMDAWHTRFIPSPDFHWAGVVAY